MRSATRSSRIMSISVVALDVLGVAASAQALGVEVRLAAELHDALRDQVGVRLLLAGVLEELVGDGLGVDARRHEVVALVAQDADDLGRERLVQQPRRPSRDRRRSVSVTAPFSMCCRARSRNSWMSERKGGSRSSIGVAMVSLSVNVHFLSLPPVS